MNTTWLKTTRGRIIGGSIATLVVGAVTFGTIGLASAGTVASPTRFGSNVGMDAQGNIHQCVVSGFVKPNTTLADAKGPKGAICYTIVKGSQGPAGAPGAAGASAVVTVSGTTNVTINGAHQGTMQGVAKFSFYSDSGAPNGALVPAGATGSSKPATTSTWYTLALPNSAHTFGGKLTAYSWTYGLAATCEQWVDSINPGDDGQSAADGNITGTNTCN